MNYPGLRNDEMAPSHPEAKRTALPRRYPATPSVIPVISKSIMGLSFPLNNVLV